MWRCFIFSCPEFRIDCQDLQTEDFNEAENRAMAILQDRLNELTKKM